MVNSSQGFLESSLCAVGMLAVATYSSLEVEDFRKNRPKKMKCNSILTKLWFSNLEKSWDNFRKCVAVHCFLDKNFLNAETSMDIFKNSTRDSSVWQY